MLEDPGGDTKESEPAAEPAKDSGGFDAASFAELSRTHTAEGRYRELATIIEGLLAQSPGPSATDAANLRVRAVLLYRDTLREPLRAMHHLERLLKSDPVSEAALQAAESLLDLRLLGHRLAPLLVDAYARLRRPHDELAVLERELKLAHPPRLGEVQRRLAILRLDVKNDASGALDLLRPLVLSNPGDDEVRRRFLEISTTAGRATDAARALSRALTYTKDEAARARVGYDLGQLHLAQGDDAAALSAFEAVTRAGGTEDAVLASARKLVELLGPAADPKRLARALEALCELEPTASRRHDAAKRLAELAETLQLGARYSVTAWRALADSPEGDLALSKLEELCQASGDERTLADVLERKSARAPERTEARALGLRAAESYGKLGNPDGALRILRQLVDRFGPSRDVLSRMAELLEQTGSWEKFVNVVENAVRLAEPREQTSLWARAGLARLSRLNDAEGALHAFRRSLALDPGEETSRTALERLLRQGRHRLAASEILEPIYRNEGQTTRLLEVLETRAELLSEDAAKSLQLLAEAADIAEEEPRDDARGIRLCRRALLLAKSNNRRLLRPWLERLNSFTTSSGRPDRMAEISLEVLGDTEKLEPELVEFARVVAEAFEEAGNLERARAFLSRALSENPTSPDLLARIDAILAREGAPPSERIARYRAALELESATDRRASLLHTISRLELEDLQAPGAAAATLELLVRDHPEDWEAHTRLLEAYDAVGDTEALDAELDRALRIYKGRERQVALARRIARLLAQGDEPRALELCRALLDEADAADEALDAAERVFEQAGDFEYLERTLERRVAAAESTTKKADALERLGDFLLNQLGQPAKAVDLWKTGARACGAAPEERKRATRLYERILDTLPDDQEAAGRLVELYAESSEWAKVPEVYAVCVRGDPSDARRVEVLLALAPRAAHAGAADEFIALADEALWRTGPKSTGFGRQILAAKAAVLASSRGRELDATLTFRDLIDSYGDEEDVRAYIAFLDATPSREVRREGVRWIHPWRAARASDPVPVLLEWAHIEEERLRDPEGAISVYERIVGHDSANRDALEQIVRLAGSIGNWDRALDALEKLRSIAPEGERVELDLRMARLAIDELGQPEQAVRYVARAVDAGNMNDTVMQLGSVLLASPDARAATAAAFDRALTRASVQDSARITRFLLDSTQGATEIRDLRHAWRLRLLGEDAADAPSALPLAVEAAVEFPDAEDLWTRVEELGRKVNDLGAVGSAYRRALEAELAPETAERLGARAADFFEQVLGDPASATFVLARVLALAPRARWALDRVKLTLTLQRRYEELLELYGRAIDAELDPAQKADLLDEAVVVARDLASEPDVAMGLLERLLSLRPSDTRIETSLERLYERRGQTRRLIDLLLLRVARVPEKEAFDLRARISGLWIDLGEARPALLLAEPMLGDAQHGERAMAVLEAILELPPPPGEEDLLRAAQRRAATLLEREYSRLARTSDVLRVTERDLELCEDPSEKVQKLRQIVSWSLGEPADPERAFDALCALIRLEPSVVEHRTRAGELPNVASRDERLAQVLTQAAEDSTPPRPDLLLSAARLYGDVLGDRERAIERYSVVLDSDASERTVALDAARRLERLLFAEGRAAERCTVLERVAELSEDVAEQRAALTEAARVALDELGDAARSAAIFGRVVAAHPSDMDAIGGLIQALRATSRPLDLIQALETRSLLVSDPAAARRDRVRIATIYLEELGDVAAATTTWELIRTQFGADVQTFEALSQLYENAERWNELMTLLAAEAERETETERRNKLNLRLAELLLDRAGDVLAAVRHYALGDGWEVARGVVANVSSDARLAVPALSVLVEMAKRSWEASPVVGDAPVVRAALWATQTLASTLVTRGDYQAAFDLCLEASNFPFAQKHRRELELWAARLSDERLGQPERSVEILRRLFAEDPSDGVAAAAAEWYGALLGARGLHAEEAELWEGQAWRASQSGNRTQGASLWVRAAEIWESLAANVDRALAANTQAAELGSETALSALARLHRGRGEGLLAAEALDALLVSAPEHARIPRAIDAADAYLEIGERGVARARLEEALKQQGDVTEVRSRLADLYRKDGAWALLADLLESGANAEPDPARRADVFCEVARLYADKLGDPGAAAVRLEHAVSARPDRDELVFELAELLGASGKHGEAIAVLQRRVDAYEGRKPRERARVHGRLSELLLSAGRRAESMEELQLAAQIDPTRAEILYRLAQLARDEGRLADAEQTLRALLLALRRPATSDERAPALAEVYLGLSEVARLKGDTGGADDFIESAFDAAQTGEREATKLESALASLGRRDLVLRAVEARLDRAPTPAQAAVALADAVALRGSSATEDPAWRTRVNDSAARSFAALETEVSSPALAWRALHKVFSWLGDEARLPSIVEHWVAASQSDATGDAEHWYELSAECFSHAEHREGGVALLERALESRPDLDRAVALLTPLLDEEPPSERAIRLLERICRSPGRESLRTRALSRIADLPGAGPAEVRAAVDHALARDDRAVAKRALEATLARKNPRFQAKDRAFVCARLASLAEESGELGRAAELYERAATDSEPREATELSRRAATLYAERLGEYDRALAILHGLIDQHPSDETLWSAALDVHGKTARPAELIELIERNAGHVERVEQRVALLLRQAKLLLSRGDADAALSVLERIAGLDPAHAESADLRADLLEKAGRHDELAQALGARARAARSHGDPARAAALFLDLGKALERLSRPADALTAYREVLGAEATHLEALRAITRLSESTEVPIEALASALDTLSAVEQGPRAADAALRLAMIRSEQGDEPRAEAALLRGFSIDPTHGRILDELLGRYSERGLWAELADITQRALASSPGRRDLVLRAGEALRHTEQYDRALELLDSLGNDDAEATHERFIVLRAARRRASALVALESAARLDDRYIGELTAELEGAAADLDAASIESHVLGLIELVERSGDTVRARDLLRRLSQSTPPPRAALERLARWERDAGNWPEAMAAYRQLLSLDIPEGIEEAALGLADACEKLERAADARADLERALERSPGSGKLRARLRDLYVKIGARDQLARTYLSEASDNADPLARVGALVNAGALMLETGDRAQAIRALERAHEQEPAHFEAALLLSAAYRGEGRVADALSALYRTAALHSKTRSKDVARLHVQIADLHLSTDDLVEAFEAARNAVDIDKSDLGTALLVGLLAIDLGHERVAQQALQTVVMSKPQSATGGDSAESRMRGLAYYHLAKMARETGDDGRARLMVSKALKEDAENQKARRLLESLGAPSNFPGRPPQNLPNA